MNFLYQKETYIPFQLGDAAGIVFFAHAFSLAHEVYELFVQQTLNITWDNWFNHPEWIVPIKHSQASYHLSLKVGSTYLIGLNIKKIGKTSFILHFSFMEKEALFCEVETVHVFCNRHTLQKEPIPSLILEKFN